MAGVSGSCLLLVESDTKASGESFKRSTSCPKTWASLDPITAEVIPCGAWLGKGLLTVKNRLPGQGGRITGRFVCLQPQRGDVVTSVPPLPLVVASVPGVWAGLRCLPYPSAEAVFCAAATSKLGVK